MTRYVGRRPRTTWHGALASLGHDWPRLTTKQVWVLLAVAHGRVRRLIEFGELAVHELDGRSVSWTVTTLAVRGLVLIDPTCPGPPQLSRRGQLILHNAGLIPAGPNIT
jgi:hypothetical protein